MLFNSYEMKEVAKNIAVFAASNIGVFLVGSVVRKVIDNEKKIKDLRVRVILQEYLEKGRREFEKESELKE